MRLFERRGHALTLTARGQAYLPELSDALDRISAATLRLMEHEDQPLRITVLPSFASRWLVPRLEAFRKLHPEVDLRLDSSAELWAFSTERFDLGIRSGLGEWTGLKADLIARETLSPVCSPVLVNSHSPIRVPADLRHARMLFDTPRDAWQRWFDAAGVDGPEMDTGASFNDASLALQAAVDGQGVALGRLTLAADDLRCGRLVQPFDVVLPNDYSYWLVYQQPSLSKSHVAAFRRWLLAEASASESGRSFIGSHRSS